MRIALLGDVMLGRLVARSLRSSPPQSLWSTQLRELALGCDLVVCNLECCISERGRRTNLIHGKPFFFRAPPAAVDCLRALGVRAVSLANNHALDYGGRALADTVALLDSAGIRAAGAGLGPAVARRGIVVDAGATRVGLLAVTDHPSEYAVRTGAWGVALADLSRGLPDWLTEELNRLRRESDVAIAFPHWGPNMTHVPARWQRNRAADLLEAGATLVAGHSAHVPHGVERLSSGYAIYDLGGAIDDYAVDDRLRNDLGVLALWSPGGSQELELVGLKLDRCHTDLATAADAAWLTARLERACGELGTTARPVAENRWVID